MTRRARARALNVRGNIALTVALTLGGFLTLVWAGAGRWTSLHTWLVTAAATAAATATACFLLAGRRTGKDSPRGDSPQVTHPAPTASLTPSEVRK